MFRVITRTPVHEYVKQRAGEEQGKRQPLQGVGPVLQGHIDGGERDERAERDSARRASEARRTLRPGVARLRHTAVAA